jgi:site-specific recombinase XerC
VRRLRVRIWRRVRSSSSATAAQIAFRPGSRAKDSAFEAQQLSSSHTSPDSFVFCKPDGSPLNPDVVRRDMLYPALDGLGIPRSSRTDGFHTFRHSATSLINARTGNLKLAQKLLGHSNLSTTADVYTHTSAEADATAALALEIRPGTWVFQATVRVT